MNAPQRWRNTSIFIAYIALIVAVLPIHAEAQAQTACGYQSRPKADPAAEGYAVVTRDQLSYDLCVVASLITDQIRKKAVTNENIDDTMREVAIEGFLIDHCQEDGALTNPRPNQSNFAEFHNYGCGPFQKNAEYEAAPDATSVVKMPQCKTQRPYPYSSGDTKATGHPPVDRNMAVFDLCQASLRVLKTQQTMTQTMTQSKTSPYPLSNGEMQTYLFRLIVDVHLGLECGGGRGTVTAPSRNDDTYIETRNFGCEPKKP